MKARLLLAALCISSIAWADHLRLTIDRPAGVGVSSQFLVVERLTDAGTPQTSGALSVTVTTNSTTGQYHSAPWFFSGWQTGSSYPLSIGSGGASTSFVYRDLNVGTHDLTVSAAGFASVTAPISVETTLIAEDFEGRILPTDSPAGIWQFRDVQPGNALDFAQQGAHWGDGGLYMVDNTNLPDAGGEGVVGFFTASVTNPIYFRGWVRRTATSPGSTTMMVMHSPGGPIVSFEATLTGAVGFGGATANGYPWELHGASLQPNRWYLVNGKITGLGTTNGLRALNISDAGTLTQGALDFTGLNVQNVFLGNSWGEPRSFLGSISWDDFRVSTVPQGDTLVATMPASIPTSECTPFSVGLSSTLDSVDALAPYDVDVQIGLDVGAVHRAADCSDAAAQTVRIPKGQLSGTAYLLGGGTLGTVELRVSHPDFLSGATTFSLVAASVDGGSNDGGTLEPDRPAARLDVGCGCSSAMPLLPLALLAVLGARRTRRRQR